MSTKIIYRDLVIAKRQGNKQHLIKKIRVRQTEKSYIDDSNGTRFKRLDLDGKPLNGQLGEFSSCGKDSLGWTGYNLYDPDSPIISELRKDIEDRMTDSDFKKTVCDKLRDIADNPMSYADDYLPKLKMLNDLLESDEFKNAIAIDM